MRSTLLAAALLAGSTTVQSAEDPKAVWVCGPDEDVRGELGKLHQKIMWSGWTEMGHELLLLSSADLRTFTVLERQADGDVCVIHRGKGSKLAQSFVVTTAASE